MLLAGCAGGTDDADGTGDADDSRASLYRVAGTVALGRPGRWAEVCLANRCTRADSEGDYRLSWSADASRLATANIPNADGSHTALTGLYRHINDETTALVNINPTTEAVLDAWSRHRLERPLADCREDTACRTALTASFSEAIQATAAGQLNTWLGTAWRTERDPFGDPYVADPDLDWLDELHDHLLFSVDGGRLTLTDRNGSALASLSLAQLFDSAYAPVPIEASLLTTALSRPVPQPDAGNPIDISLSYSPGQPLEAPTELTVDASASRSDTAGDLSFHHELALPDGSLRAYTGDRISTTLDDGGPHLWVVTVTDAQGNRRTAGLELEVRHSETPTQPSFGADGSCRTEPLTVNSRNLCEETVDGGLLGQCRPMDSGQTLTTHSPARCSPIEQKGGVLLGVCTSMFNEIRVYHYDNPLRNTGESLSEQRARVAEQCTGTLGELWSRQPAD